MQCISVCIYAQSCFDIPGNCKTTKMLSCITVFILKFIILGKLLDARLYE